MGKAADGVPAERGDSRAAVAAQHRHRATGIVGMVLDELEARRAKGKGDIVKRIADRILDEDRNPIAELADLLKLLPAEPQQQAGTSLQINQLFLDAIKTVNGHGSAPSLIEARQVQGTFRVQDDATDW